jgi:hypothetical protein
MAKTVGVSKDTVQRVWVAHGLKPHLVKTFKVSNDPQFTEKLKDVVGLYLTRRNTPWCSVATRRRRFKLWIARRKGFRSIPGVAAP